MKSKKLCKPVLPSGIRDLDTKELEIKNKIVRIIEDKAEEWSYERIQTPILELASSLGDTYLPDESPSNGLFNIKDEKKEDMFLRFDLTLGLSRFVSANFNKINRPFKRFEIGSVYRNEKQGGYSPRWNSFEQADFDVMFTEDESVEAELCSLASDIMLNIGFKEKDFVINFSNRKLLEGLLNTIKINDEKKIKNIFRTVDKIDRLGISEVQKILGSGRQDSSGDKIEGIDLSENQISEIVSFLQTKDLSELKKILKDPISIEGINEIEKIFEYIDINGYSSVINFSSSLCRGLSYYKSNIFEINLNFKIKNLNNDEIVAPSVGGGGAYRGLVSRYLSEDVPGCGISLGVTRLAFILNQLDRLKLQSEKSVGICVLDKKYMPTLIKILKKLKSEKIKTELYLGNLPLKKQLQFFDRKNTEIILLIGENEFPDKVVIKNLAKGKDKSSKMQSREDWKKAEDVQKTILQKDLVNEIKKILK